MRGGLERLRETAGADVDGLVVRSLRPGQATLPRIEGAERRGTRLHAPPSSPVRMMNGNDVQQAGGRGRQGRVGRNRSPKSTWRRAVLYYQIEVPLPLRLGLGLGGGRWEMVGLGLGRLAGWRLRCTLHLHLGFTTRSCSSNPLLPRNQHPSPTTAFTNIKRPRYFY